jgi:NTE family protein
VPVSRVEHFLASVPVLASLQPQQLTRLATRVAEREYRTGDLILRTGERNRSLYLLESGRLAVQVSRGETKETVAYLHPGAPFGELSLITGRSCSADVRVIADATVAVISEATLNELPEERRLILEMLALTLAERLHASVSGRTETEGARVVLLHQSRHWEARSAFAAELVRSLARQAEWTVLRVDFNGTASGEPRPDGDGVSVAVVAASRSVDALHAELSAQVASWRRRFACIVLNTPPELVAHAAALTTLADWHGHLLGRSDPFTRNIGVREFVVQESAAATLPKLSGREQLIDDVKGAENAHASQRPVSARFRRTVDSVARGIAQLQVGVALGGGGAWAWSHIGVLRVLERAGVPVDVVSGCSMGSYVAALFAIGCDISALEQAAREWHRRFRRVIEYRFWRMHLGRVSGVTSLLRDQFSDRLVNRTDVPFWANALDIETAEEVTLADGDLVSALLASMALPAWLPPKSRDSRLLVDAVLVDPVPARLTRRMHCHFNIAVNAIGPFKARALETRFPFRAYDFVSRCLRIVGHQIGQARIEASADVILVPDLPADTTMLSFDRQAAIVAAGEREAEARLPSILATYGNLRRAALSSGQSIATS